MPTWTPTAAEDPTFPDFAFGPVADLCPAHLPRSLMRRSTRGGRRGRCRMCQGCHWPSTVLTKAEKYPADDQDHGTKCRQAKPVGSIALNVICPKHCGLQASATPRFRKRSSHGLVPEPCRCPGAIWYFLRAGSDEGRPTSSRLGRSDPVIRSALRSHPRFLL